MALPEPPEPGPTRCGNQPPLPSPSPTGTSRVVLDVTGWRCLVVGGGPVAARRAASLRSGGAQVTVVAPDLTDALEALAGETEPSGQAPALAVERRRYRPGEAAHYRLVATATGRPEVDAAVVADAVGAGVLVTSAERAVPGTVRLPAVHRSGAVTLAVSTAGTSPALARWLCDRLAGCLPPRPAHHRRAGRRGPHGPPGGRPPDRRHGLGVPAGPTRRAPGRGRPGRRGRGRSSGPPGPLAED